MASVYPAARHARVGVPAPPTTALKDGAEPVMRYAVGPGVDTGAGVGVAGPGFVVPVGADPGVAVGPGVDNPGLGAGDDAGGDVLGLLLGGRVATSTNDRNR